MQNWPVRFSTWLTRIFSMTLMWRQIFCSRLLLPFFKLLLDDPHVYQFVSNGFIWCTLPQDTIATFCSDNLTITWTGSVSDIYDIEMQAHFSRVELPITDYVTDLKSVLDQSIRILQAMIDVCANSGWLSSTITCMHLLQMVMQVI